MQKKYDLKGLKFSKLTVLKFYSSINNRRYWLCICDCGNEAIVASSYLRNGSTQSCGCLHKECWNKIVTKHNKSFSQEYNSWANMKARCSNPNHPSFSYYGGKGITYCKEWDSFINFYNDMGELPTPNHTLDRIENNKGYSKDNCRWATRKEQADNRDYVTHDKIDGVIMNRKEVANHIGIASDTVKRYYDKGFTAQEIKTIFSKKIA